MTRDRSWKHTGVTTVHSVEEAIDCTSDGAAVMVIGGGEVYQRFLAHADAVERTVVHTSVDGDTSFPALDPAMWSRVSASEHGADERNRFDLTFERWERRLRYS